MSEIREAFITITRNQIEDIQNQIDNFIEEELEGESVDVEISEIRDFLEKALDYIDNLDDDLEDCEFCGETLPAGVGRYGCPNCEGEGLE